MNDDQYLLANAYVDGELTDDERRIAEADPEVMLEVEQLRGLQADLRAVAGPTDVARESAIGAAMAAFGAQTAASAPASVPFRPRPSYARYLGIAAAVVAVAGLGIIISQANLGGDDDDAGSTADVASEATMEAADGARESNLESMDAAEIAAETEGGGGDADDTAADDAAPTVAELASDEMSTALAAGEMGDTANESTAEATSDSGAAAYLGEPRSVPTDFDPAELITDDEALGVYGVYLIGERNSSRLGSTPNTPCTLDDSAELLDEAEYLVDGSPVPVYIAVVEAQGVVLALDTDTCAEIAVGTLYEN